MRLDTPRHIGLYVKNRRRQLGMTQAQLAERAGVSQRWVSALEGGKASAEVGLVLQVFAALDVIIDTIEHENLPKVSHAVDLDAILREHTGGSSDG